MQWWNNKQKRKGLAPLLAFLAPIIGGLLGAGGSMYASNRNRQSVKDQMAFQERMSSTAAQRSVEDYRRAGLNPALAYERTASSPSGGSTQFEDPLSKGMSSAMNAASFIQDMKQRKANLHLTETQDAATLAANARDTSQSHLNNAAAGATTLRLGWEGARQPHDLAGVIAQNLLTQQQSRLTGSQAYISEKGQVAASNQEEFEKQLGKLSRAGGLVGGGARTAAELIRMLSPIKRY